MEFCCDAAVIDVVFPIPPQQLRHALRGCQDSCLTTGNTLLLLQQIAGAQAEAILKHADATMLENCRFENRWVSRVTKMKKSEWGCWGQRVHHNKLLSMTKQCWHASSTAPDTHVSPCVCLRQHPSIRSGTAMVLIMLHSVV